MMLVFGRAFYTLLGGRGGLLRVLQDAEWNVARAARVLGVTRRTVYLRLQRYGIDREAQDRFARVLATQ